VDVLRNLKAPNQIEPSTKIKLTPQVLSFDKMRIFAGADSSARRFNADNLKPHLNKLPQCTPCSAPKIDKW
jgi:hypothetical protein